jgi:protein gp37
LPRIEDLRNTPAAVRFLSVEPLLEDLGEIDLQGIQWVIVGGESGPWGEADEAGLGEVGDGTVSQTQCAVLF